jgi:hypothetical protein
LELLGRLCHRQPYSIRFPRLNQKTQLGSSSRYFWNVDHCHDIRLICFVICIHLISLPYIFLRDLSFSETFIEMLKFKEIPRSITLNLCQINYICSSVNLYSKLTFLRIVSNFLGSSRYRGIFGNALYPSPG